MNCCKRVLVTGATGLIGKELIEPLKEAGFDIFAITIDKNNPDNCVHWISGNLFDENSIKTVMEEVKPEYLLNMAWCTTGDYLSSDTNYKFLRAGISLLKYFKDNGGKRAVFAGTCFEYKFKDSSLKETDELDADKTVYTFCKNKLHEVAEFFCGMNNISFGYGRIFYVYGRNEDKTRLTGMIIDKLSRNEEVIIKSGKLYKDYMYAKDIAGAFVALLNSKVEGSVNICTGKAVSIKDFALEIGKQMGKENLIKFKDEPSNQPPIIVGDNSKLTKEVRYEYKLSLKDGVKLLMESLI
ncbi:MAG: NAD(P)-dependent oxidoreductase [Elusimicrobia bacterium]|nr:NAD(P)-dependent oxidoreductase [Elusimicrobiota bacterium]